MKHVLALTLFLILAYGDFGNDNLETDTVGRGGVTKKPLATFSGLR